MSRTLLQPSWYEYRMLKEKFPDGSKYESEYTEGGYLNTDYTTYYVDGKEVFTKSHGNYS